MAKKKARTLADRLRENSCSVVPAKRRGAAKKYADKILKQVHQLIRGSAILRSTSGRARRDECVVTSWDFPGIHPVAYTHLLQRIAERLRADGLKVTYKKEHVNVPQEPKLSAWRFTVRW